MKSILSPVLLACCLVPSLAQVTINVSGTDFSILTSTNNGQIFHYTPVSPTSFNSTIAGKYNIVFIADAFTSTNQNSFNTRVQSAVNVLLAKAPFSSHNTLFNFYRINLISTGTAIGALKQIPDAKTKISGIVPQRASTTALNTYYGDGTLIPFEFVFSQTPELIHQLVGSILPDYDAIVVVSQNTEVFERGMNVYGITFIGMDNNVSVFFHEMGHQIGRLGDEYFDNASAIGAYSGCEPSFPNLTTCNQLSTCSNTDACSINRLSKLNKWRSVSTDLPLPSGGGGLYTSGVFRPKNQCCMGIDISMPFCDVCRDALILNLCAPPKPPHITSDGLEGEKYIEIPKGGLNLFNPPDDETEMIELDISINYLFENKYDIVPCENNTQITYTAVGEPGASFTWFEVIRNNRTMITYKPLTSNILGHPEQIRLSITDTFEIACTQTVNNCISDYRHKLIIPSTRWVIDSDNDGYYTGFPIRSCNSPGPAYKVSDTALPGDCFDSDKLINPGAAEICNTIDENCNGIQNDGLISTRPTEIIRTGTPAPFCIGSTADITLNVQGGQLGSGAVYRWYEGSQCGHSSNLLIGEGNQIVVTVSETTKYFVRAEGCNTTSCELEQISVFSPPDPAIKIISNDSVCIGGKIELEPLLPETLTELSHFIGVPNREVTDAIYTWSGPYSASIPEGSDVSDTKVNIIATPSSGGTYTLTTQFSPTGCVGQSSVDITVLPPISNNSISADQSICMNTTPNELIGSVPVGVDDRWLYIWEQSINGNHFTRVSNPPGGPGNNINYSPPPLSQSTWYRRTVNSAICGQAPASTSNSIKITIISGAIGQPSPPNGLTSICHNTRNSVYTTSATNAVRYEWTVSDGSPVTTDGASATVNWNPPIGPKEVSVVAVGCPGTSGIVTTHVERLLCPPPPIKIGCQLSGPAALLCNFSLGDLCSRLSIGCIDNCNLNSCDDLKKWKFKPEGISGKLTVYLIASSNGGRSGRRLAKTIYGNGHISIPYPKAFKLKSNETLWLQFKSDKKTINDGFYLIPIIS